MHIPYFEDTLLIVTALFAVAALVVTYLLAGKIGSEALEEAPEMPRLSENDPDSHSIGGPGVEPAPQPVARREVYDGDWAEELRYARGILEHELARKKYSKPWLEDALSSGMISVIFSNYSNDKLIQRFQNRLIGSLEELNGGRCQLKPKESGTFDEVLADQCGHKKFLYVFPMYLTDVKRERGFAVVPYGKHRQLGALIPQSNIFCPIDDVDSRVWNLSDLLAKVNRFDGSVYCLQNYAVSEIIFQTIDSSDELRMDFDLKRVRSIGPSLSGQRVALGPVNSLSALTSSNWVYIFDLGDWKRLEAELRESELQSARLFTVPHGQDIPVGVGCNRYALPWLLESLRGSRLKEILYKELSDANLVSQMGKMGISTVRMQSDMEENIVQLTLRAGK